MNLIKSQRLPGERVKRGGFLMKKISEGILIVLCLLGPSMNVRAESQGVPSTYDDGIPVNVRIYCEVIGAQYDICPEILEAIAYHESRFFVDVTNGKHYGLMQVNVKVHEDRIFNLGYTVEDMTSNAYANIEVAADYLKELYDTYGDENPIVLSVYSGNWKAVSDYKENSFICPYVNDILERSAKYERLHKK